MKTIYELQQYFGNFLRKRGLDENSISDFNMLLHTEIVAREIEVDSYHTKRLLKLDEHITEGEKQAFDLIKKEVKENQ